MPETLSGRTAVAAGWLIAWRTVTRGIGIASTLLLARILVPADFGLVAMATAFSAALDALSALGLQEALIRKPEDDRRLYDTAFTMQAARGLLTGALLALAGTAAGAWFGEPRLSPILLVLAATAALSGFENIGVVEFRRALHFHLEFRLLFLPRVAQFVVTIVAALITHSHWALVAGIAVAKLGRLLMTYVVHPYRPRFSLREWRELIGFSLWTWAAAMLTLLWERFDPFLLGPVFGAGNLGVYLLSAEIAVMPVSELVQPATGALFAGAAAARRQGNEPIETALPICLALLMLALPLCIAISATSGYLITGLFAEQWQPAWRLIAIFAWASVFAPFSFVGTTLLVAATKLRENVRVLLCAVAVKVVLMCAASRLHDLDLTALAALACAAAEAVLFALQLRACGMRATRRDAGCFGRMLLSGLLTVGAFYAAGLGWQPVSQPGSIAILQGGLLGVSVITCFAALQVMGWIAAGRPDGPESRLLGIGRQIAGRVLARRALGLS